MTEQKWLLASGNAGKIREIREILKEMPLTLLGLQDCGIEIESPETGDSFLSNAMQKAQFYYQQAKLPVLADDSGLEVDALGGAPGIHSARFGGFPTHAEKCAYMLGLLAETPGAYRSARFRCAAVYYDGARYISAEATVEGYIGQHPKGAGGFGYDPIFCPELDGPSLAEIPQDEKNAMSHRGKAFRELRSLLLQENLLV